MSGARNQEEKERRQRALLALVRERGSVSVATLPDLFGVSAETTRRDLRALERRGAISRAYGSVRAVDASRFETDVDQRADRDIAQKRRIAAAAASCLGDAQTIYIDEGHLPSLILEHLPSSQPLTIVTPSLTSAAAAAKLPHVTAIVLGGRVRPATLGVVDHFALDMLTQLALDCAFIGTNGVGNDGALSTPDPAVAATKRAAISASRRAIFVGTHTKFGASSFVRFAHLNQFCLAITGVELSPSRARLIERGDTPLHRV
ncbi:MAG: DeoR/GlpR family DNA-binding transcription regulator [Actinomycetaceae bacterium]|nr:DeoR/GlpR family DNA-binding transcription regulator [Actinomycetaceae bacterium]